MIKLYENLLFDLASFGGNCWLTVCHYIHSYCVRSDQFCCELFVWRDWFVHFVDHFTDICQVLRRKKSIEVKSECHLFLFSVETDINESIMAQLSSPKLRKSLNIHQISRFSKRILIDSYHFSISKYRQSFRWNSIQWASYQERSFQSSP